MSFIIFFIYLTICLVIYGLLGVLIFKVFFQKKKNDFLDTNIDDIWNNFYNIKNEEKGENDDFLKKVR